MLNGVYFPFRQAILEGNIKVREKNYKFLLCTWKFSSDEPMITYLSTL